MVGVPPDMGNDYARELERRRLEESFQRRGFTRPPGRLTLGQKLLVLGVGFLVALVLLLVWAIWTSPQYG
jgi:hypothetical protein